MKQNGWTAETQQEQVTDEFPGLVIPSQGHAPSIQNEFCTSRYAQTYLLLDVPSPFEMTTWEQHQLRLPTLIFSPNTKKRMRAISNSPSTLRRGINPASRPSGTGCVECLATGGWWLHLRRCAECGHIGCCDTSPNQHASKHAASAGHPVVRSFEPRQNWFFDYEKRKIVKGVSLPAPKAHPDDQPAPGPAGRVPDQWLSLLHGMDDAD